MTPLVVWAVSDGRAGIEAQALGLAEAVARLRSSTLVVKRIGWKAGLGRLPWRLIPTAARSGDRIAAPWPDIWIAAGRATLPLSTRMKAWSQGATFVVQAQDPRTSLAPFDLVVPPEHDGLAGPNVLSILGAPNRLAPEALAQALARFEPELSSLPRPRVAVIVGGPTRGLAFTADRGRAQALEIDAAIRRADGSVMVSFTRRTPPDVKARMAEILSASPGRVWDGTGENPYFGFLALADAILVTEDSTNLATDAAATGKPVFVLPLEGRREKLARFHAELRARGVARPFEGLFEAPAYAPLRETDRAAAEILRRYDARPRNGG